MTARSGAVEDLKRTFAVLSRDVDASVALRNQQDSQFARRTVIRTQFAFIEGLANSLAAVAARSAPVESGILSVGDLALLEERDFALDDRGELVCRNARLPLLKRIRHVLRCYPRIHGASFDPHYGGAGWQALRDSLELRHRLTHPKNETSLRVSDEEFEKAAVAFDWFQTTIRDLLKECASADAQY